MWRFRKYGGLAKCELPFDGHDFSLTAPSMSMRVCSAHMSMRAYATLPTISEQSMASLLPEEESCSSKYKDTRSLGSTLIHSAKTVLEAKSKVSVTSWFLDVFPHGEVFRALGSWAGTCALCTGFAWWSVAHVHCVWWSDLQQIEWSSRRKGRFRGKVEGKGTSWLGSRRKEGVFYCSGSGFTRTFAHADLRQKNILIMESVIHILNVGAELIFGSNFSAVIKL